MPMLVPFDTTHTFEAASSAVVMVVSAMDTETCESCGREFGCGADESACWCAQHALSPARRAILREHFERCLCPDCLRMAMHDPLHSG